MRVSGATLRDFHYPRLWLGLWIAGLILTVATCVLPLPKMPLPTPIIHLDKIEHLVAYTVLAGWAAMLFAARRALAWAVCGLIGLGLAIEGVQSMLPWRSASAGDVIANLVGVVLGGVLVFTPLTRTLQRLDGWLARRA